MLKQNPPTDDISFEPEDIMEQEAGTESKIKKLRAELKTCQAERQEHLDGWQRARADFVNLKRENEESTARLSNTLTNRIFTDIIPILDSFDMAMKNKTVWEAVDSQWRTGVEYIYQQFLKLLDDYSITRIADTNVPFDPQIHEPLETISVTDEKEHDSVIEIIQAGYKRNDVILRPAKVKVGEYSE